MAGNGPGKTQGDWNSPGRPLHFQGEGSAEEMSSGERTRGSLVLQAGDRDTTACFPPLTLRDSLQPGCRKQKGRGRQPVKLKAEA